MARKKIATNSIVPLLFLSLLVGTALTGEYELDGRTQDDFENGEILNGWTANNLESGDSKTVQTSKAYEGSYALEVETDGDGNGVYTIEKNLSEPIREGNKVTFGWFYTTNGYFDLLDLIGFTENDRGILYRKGYIEWRGGNGQWGDCRISYNSDTWYKIEFKFNSDGSETLYITPKGGTTQSTNCQVSSSSNITRADYIRDSGASPQATTTYADIILYDSQPPNSPPQFDNISSTPESWNKEQETNFTVNVSDTDGYVESVSATVREGGNIIKDGVPLSNTSKKWEEEYLFKTDEPEVYYNVSLNATDDDGEYSIKHINKSTENASITWNHSGNPEGFKIYSNSSSEGMKLTAKVSSSNYEHISTALTNSYVCYKVTAYNEYGESSSTSPKCEKFS